MLILSALSFRRRLLLLKERAMHRIVALLAVMLIGACANTTDPVIGDYTIRGLFFNRSPNETAADPGCHMFRHPSGSFLAVILPNEQAPRTLMWGTRCPEFVQDATHNRNTFVSQRTLALPANGGGQYAVSLGPVGPNNSEVWCRGMPSAQQILDCRSVRIVRLVKSADQPFRRAG